MNYDTAGIEYLKGWHDLIQPLVKECKEKGILITQIKEKFGTLRFYTGPASDEFHAKVHEAEKKSATMCEVCGKPGILRGDAWLYTSCDEHIQK